MLDIGPLVMGGTRFTQQSKSIVFNMGKKKERKREKWYCSEDDDDDGKRGTKVRTLYVTKSVVYNRLK